MLITSRVLNLLKDGKGHEAREIAKLLGIPMEKTLALLRFLEEYGFLRLDGETQMARADPSLLRLLS